MLSHASLEVIKTSGGRAGKESDDKYSLLNSDEHIGIMRKMGRDISEARPDITHQVIIFHNHIVGYTDKSVPPHTPRLANQQGRETTSLHPDCKGRPHRSQPDSPTAADIQAFRRSNGAIATQTLDSLQGFSRKTAQSDQESNHGSLAAELPKGDIVV